jgi:hypothetical protein
MRSDSVLVIVLPYKSGGQGIESCNNGIFFFSGFLEISEGSRVKCFRKFPKGEGLKRLRKFTGQGTCSHIHSEVFLGNMRCFWDSVEAPSQSHVVNVPPRNCSLFRPTQWVPPKNSHGSSVAHPIPT